MQKSVSLTLDAHERARVNEMLGAGLTDQPRDLFLALSDRNIAPASDLEARLVDVEVSAFEGEGGDLVNDGLSVELDAGAQGTLRSRSGTLTFRYDRDANVWGASVDLTTHPRTIHPLKRPEDIARTLGAILDLPAPKGYTTNPPLLPGLWLRLHRLGQNAAPLVVRELTLTLTYSTHPATNVRAIHVACDDDCGGKPLVYVSAPDLSGAQHGYGSFTRVFGGAFPIKLIAQAESGGRPFAGWYGPDRLIESSTALDLPLVNGSFYFRACYGR